jgi:1-deoxy-D-xylulose-5-phosphate synthase
MVLPDIFIDQASPADMYAIAELGAAEIEARVLDVLDIAQISGKRA